MKGFFTALFRGIGRFLVFLFGRHSLPGWISWIVDGFRDRRFQTGTAKMFRGIGDFLRRHRLSAALAGLAVLLAVVGLSAYLIWQSKQPQLIQLSIMASSPAPTDYETGTIYPLTLDFDGSAAALEAVGQPVTEGVKLDPELPGEWRWESDSRLVFYPSQDWPLGQRYTVRFAKTFFPSHLKVDTRAEFNIADFSADLYEAEFYINPENSADKRVLATLRASHPMDASKLSGLITIYPNIDARSGSLDKKDYAFELSYNDTRTEAYIVSSPIGMPASNSDMVIELKPGLASTAGGRPLGEKRSVSVLIPGAADYVKITGIGHQLVRTADQRYDQVLIVESRGETSAEDLAAKLQLFQLPLDRPALPGLEAVPNHGWGSLGEMTPEVMALAKPVKFEVLPGEKKYNALNSFRFNAEPGRYLYAKVKEGLKFLGDYYLSQDAAAIFRVEEYPRELAILSDGAILSLQGDKKLAMLSRGISGADFKIGRIRPDDINHLVSQTYGELPKLGFDNYQFNEYNITEQYRKAQTLPPSDPRDVVYLSFDFSEYLSTIPEKNLRYGLFFFSVIGTAGDGNQYSDKRLIMVTDLGFLIKDNADGSRDVFVQSIADGDPVGGALVQVLGLNGNSVASGYTDVRGHVELPALGELRNERTPTVITVSLGNDLSFLPWNSGSQRLDYSSFDVGGVVGAADPRTVSAYLFSDRGIYRPGDEMRIGSIVKAGDWKINLAGTPLEYQIVDSRGSEIFAKRVKLLASGYDELRYRTLEYAPTGAYQISLYLIREKREGVEKTFLGSVDVKVEEFLPDNLTVTASLEPTTSAGWISPEALQGRVGVRNLFGTPAVGNKVKAQVTLTPGFGSFRDYRDFTFFDPYRKERGYDEPLGEAVTDGEGMALFPIDLSRFEKASYRLRFFAQAYEAGGGRSVSAESSVLVSPLPYLIGYRADGDLGYINQGGKRVVSFVAVNPKLERTGVAGVNFAVEEIRYISVLMRQPNGVYKYQSVKKTFPVSAAAHDIGTGGYEYSLFCDRAGQFAVKVADPAGDVYADFEYTVIGKANLERSLERTAEVEIRLSRPDVKPGEELEVFIKTPYAGAGLITIERDKVYEYRWFKIDSRSGVVKIPVPEGLEGNGYVSVAFTRASDSPEIYMSPFCYGTASFSVSRDARTNAVSLTIPSSSKPGEDFVIKYATAKPGKIVIFAVDEGILQVARYKTPDPLAFFFRKRALEVGTAQILNLILPEYSVLKALGAMGGGDEGDFLSRNLNPFRRKQLEPVAYWSGLLDCGPAGGEVRYRVPEYFNGTLRVMAVAVSADSIGVKEDSAIIRDTYIIKPAAPMAAAPNDRFEVTVTVGNNRVGSGPEATVELKATPSANLSIVSAPTVTLTVPEGADRVASFTVLALDRPGAAEISFVASGGGEKSKNATYLSIRPAMPYRVELYGGYIKDGRKDLPIARRLLPELRKLKIDASYAPLSLAGGLSVFLENYPYGCSEQLVSATFARLFPSLVKDVKDGTAQTKETVERTISILQARQRPDGGIGLWTAISRSSAAIDAYAMHFLLTAQDRGYFIPYSLLSGLETRLRSLAADYAGTWVSVNDRAYAIYALTLSGVVTTSYIEDLRKTLEQDYTDWETSYAGLYLAGAYAMMQKDDAAARILVKAKRQFKRDPSFVYFDELGYTSLYLHVVARHIPRLLGDIAGDSLLAIAGYLENQQFTTFSANMALMAIDSYTKVMPDAATGNYSFSEFDAAKRETILSAAGKAVFSAPYTDAATALRIVNGEKIPLFYQATSAGYDTVIPAAEEKRGLEVFREFLSAEAKAVTGYRLGDAATVRLRFRTTTPEAPVIADVAIVDQFPAGFEPDIAAIRDAAAAGPWQPEYIDIREDRIILYGAVTETMSEFTYTLRAVNQGTFTVPPLFAEAMYDRSRWALQPHAPLTIDK